MLHAIGEAWVHRDAAEVEVRFAGMAHRPAADLVRQIEQARLVGDFGTRLGGHEATRWRGRNRWLLVAGALALEPARADRDDLGQVGRRVGHRLRRRATVLGRTLRRSGRGLRRRGLGRWFRGGLGRCLLGRDGLRRRLLSGLLFLVGFYRGRTGFEPQPVRLADNRVAAHSAKFLGDLAGGAAAFPHLFERCDALVSPAHKSLFRSQLCTGARLASFPAKP